ncbi:MAG TPA: hypothetical protein VH089_09520, partial [Streptosporangiaceae bacterium]|nr:hypothetical protein [Streptosporangiaceae bacterium]
MRRTRRIIAAAGILSTAGIASVAAATMAGATTSQCANNPYCYTQEVNNTNLVMTATGYGAHNGTQVVVEHQNSRSSAQDFLAGLAPFPVTPGDNAKLFEYAPKGHLSGFCVTEPRSHASLVLNYCNGSPNQAWVATPTNGSFEWINEATGDAMTDPGHNN